MHLKIWKIMSKYWESNLKLLIAIFEVQKYFSINAVCVFVCMCVCV